MITVACVLRSGGPYDRRYVQFLRDGVARNLDESHRFVCLTDVEGVWTDSEPLWHDWPGWWSKIELFRPGLFSGPVLYLDLDNIIVGDMSELAAARGFCMVRDARNAWLGASPVMAWEPGESTEQIYESFARNHDGAMASHSTGDQSWISQSHVWRDLNEICPGQLVYRWWDCLQGIPEAASVVMYHGSPKPHEVEWSTSGMYPERKYEWGKDGAMGPRRGG